MAVRIIIATAKMTVRWLFIVGTSLGCDSQHDLAAVMWSATKDLVGNMSFFERENLPELPSGSTPPPSPLANRNFSTQATYAMTAALPTNLLPRVSPVRNR